MTASSAEPEARDFHHRIGRIIRAHGLGGDVLVQMFRPRNVDPAQFKFRREAKPRSIELCYEDGRAHVHEVLGVRWTNPSTFAAQLSGITSRDDAERSVGAFFDVRPHDAPKGVCDEIDRIFGARVIDAESERDLGTVDDIRDNGAQAVLVVGPDEILIPWVEPFIEDVKEGRDPVVRVRPIPGLLDANQS